MVSQVDNAIGFFSDVLMVYCIDHTKPYWIPWQAHTHYFCKLWSHTTGPVCQYCHVLRNYNALMTFPLKQELHNMLAGPAETKNFFAKQRS